MNKKAAPPSLIAGPYAAPAGGPGSWLKCELRGRVKVGGVSDAPVSWPWTAFTLDGRTGSRRSLILCGDLVRAVRTESVSAISHHWGTDRKVVYGWRKALGVTRMNPGTQALWRQMAPAKLDRKKRRRPRK
jgi:hypothetical protein